MQAIKFNKKNKNEIIGMIGADPEKDKETVLFSEIVQAKGSVEKWLLNIEDMMRITLYDQMKLSVEESFKKNAILEKE